MRSLEWFEFEEVDSDTLRVISNCSETDLTPLQAAKQTVEHIISNFPPPYNLLCTGGVDSQAMLFAWKEFSGRAIHNIRVWTFLYDEYSNWYDVENLPELCSKYNLKHSFLDFELLDFLESGECLELQKRWGTYSPQMAAHIKMLDSFDGTTVMSGNFANDNIPRQTFGLGITKEHYGVLRFGKQKDNCVPFFFLHDSIITRAKFYTEETVLDYFEHLHLDKAYKNKCNLYKHFGFEITPQKNTYSGFEGFKDVYDLYYQATPFEKTCVGIRPSRRAFDIHHRYMVESKVRQHFHIIHECGH